VMVSPTRVKLSIDAPDSVKILRDEIPKEPEK